MAQSGGLTPLGKFISFLMVVGLLAVGAYVIVQKSKPADEGKQAVDHGPPPSGEKLDAPEIIEPSGSPDALPPSVAYVPKNNTIDIEISNYAGYAGLIVANGGLAPTDNSIFAKQFGFKVHLTVSEKESWAELNSGKLAASATTADVLAAYGKQFQVVTPVQIGFSRGADGIVVRKEIRRINDLRGKTLASSQFTESDFLIRYLASQAGLEIAARASLDSPVDPNKVNLVYCKEGDEAGDLFQRDLEKNTQKLAGFVGWAPRTTQVQEASKGAAHMLITNKNLLIVADMLIVNKPFARANPKIYAGLVEGLLIGNQMVHDNPTVHYPTIAAALKWDVKDAPAELAKVHFSNLPENLAFFSGAINAAGSFPSIYSSATLSYGISASVDSDNFADDSVLKTLQATGKFAGSQVEISPISLKGGATETDPLLSKDIRFLFEPNSATLDMKEQSNLASLESLKQLLRVSPGSSLLLRGHIDSTKKEEFRRQGADLFKAAELRAVELSKQRANEIKDHLVKEYGIDAVRLTTIGRGWEEANDADQAKNRRVEAQWFTVE